VAEVNVRGGGVHAELYAELTAGFGGVCESLGKLIFPENFHCTTF
jgi:hypothetical protein